MNKTPKTFRQAAAELLEELGPTHYQELTDEILSRGLVETSSRTPERSLNVMLSIDVKSNGDKSQFVRLRPGVYGLRALHAPELKAGTSTADAINHKNAAKTFSSMGENERYVRISYFPTYREVRHLLKIWPGYSEKQITGLWTTLISLRGVPQEPTDWTDPDIWIPEKLSGDDRKLASAIWNRSGKVVNPRHIYGHWTLSRRYKLIEENPIGNLVLTDRGHDFIEHEGGETEVFLDEQEGVGKLLSIVADNGPARPNNLLGEWSEYLKRYSKCSRLSTFRSTLRFRLNNLLGRGFVDRKSAMYSITDAGLDYLKRALIGVEEVLGGDEQQEFWTLAKQQRASVRESIRDLLLEMDPSVFEHLVKRLLEEMDYQNVEVRGRSGDRGVDVIADIELGITSVKEVVQVKRYRSTVQRKVLDELRGSLYRFEAIRGTIITTSRFASGAHEAAFESGAAPITLIDGDKLIDLLIEHNIGVHKRTLEVLAVDPDAFTDLEESSEEAG